MNRKLSLVLLGFVFVTAPTLLTGCNNTKCAAYGYQNVQVKRCLRRSDTGWCAHWGYSYETRRVCTKRVCADGFVRNSKGKCVKYQPRPVSPPSGTGRSPSTPGYATAPSDPYAHCSRVRSMPSVIVASDKGVIVRKVNTCSVVNGQAYAGRKYVIYNATYTPRVCSYAYYEPNGRIKVLRRLNIPGTSTRYRIKIPNGHANRKSLLKCN